MDSKKAEDSLQKTDSKAGKLAQSFGKGVKGAAVFAAGVTTAVVGVSAKFVSMAGDAETAFAKVKTLLSTDTDMTAYMNSITAASNETGIAFSDFSEAVYSAISASVDAADAVDFTTNAVKLAKGGFTDTATAVDVLTTAINAYGLTADDATHISDVLIGTQNAGKTTVDELASSMGKVIPIANAAGVGIESLSSMYAVLTKNGIATAEAGTGIKAMLAELSKTGSKTDAVIRELTEQTTGQAKSFADLSAEGMSVDEILSMVQQAAADNGLTMKDMFSSSEAATAAMTIMSDGGKDLQSILKDLTETTGTTDEAFGTMSDTFENKMAMMKNTLSNVGIQVGTELMPIVMKGLDWVQEHMPEIQAVVSNVVSEVSHVIEALMPTIQTLFDLAGELWNTSLKPALDGIIQFINGVFSGEWENAWDGIKKIFSGLWEGIKKIFKDPINWIIEKLNSFIDGINKIQIPEWVPGVGGKGLNIPKIPMLAQGGILEKGQTGFLEGTGAEAVVPLDQNRKWIKAVSDEMITVGIGGDREVKDILLSIKSAIEQLASAGVYLDGDKAVGALAPRLDAALGRVYGSAERGALA